jgi:DNA polymerase elongation subunit (family B)
VSYRRDQFGQNVRYVARITLVKGIPFYGFHVGYRFFLKIYMFNPVVMTRLADLLLQGVIMKRQFQPYEAHLQFLLQFMTDYNLYGCDYLESSKTRFRAPIPVREEESSSPHLWHSQSISPEQVTDDIAGLPRVSHCSVEVDICVHDITNRRSVKERRLHHDFVERKTPLSADLKLVHSMAGLWTDETKRRKRQMPVAEQDNSPFDPEVLVTMSADPRDSQPMGWLHEEENRDLMDELIKAEEEDPSAEALTFESFSKRTAFEKSVKTVLESVEDLHPRTLMPVLGLPTDVSDDEVKSASNVEVDDGNIQLSQPGDEDFYPIDSDEEELFRQLEIPGKLKTPARKAETTPVVNKFRTTASASQDKSGTTTSPLPGKISTPAGAVPDKFGTATMPALDKIDPTPSDEEDVFSPFPSYGTDVPDRREFIGICDSGLHTGELASIPVSKQLLSLAEERGYISRASHWSPAMLAEFSAKRKLADSPDVPAAKRARRDVPIAPPPSSQPGEGEWVPEPGQRSPENEPSPESGSTSSRKAKLARFLVGPGDQSLGTTDEDQSLGTASGSQGAAKFDNLQTQSQESHFQPSHSQQTPSTPSRSPKVKNDSQSLYTDLDLTSSFLASSPLSIDELESPTDLEEMQAALADHDPDSNMFIYGVPPPAADTAVEGLQEDGLPGIIYQDPFYSRDKDVPPRSREYAGREFRLEGKSIPYLPDFDPTGLRVPKSALSKDIDAEKAAIRKENRRRKENVTLKGWEIAKVPPSYEEVSAWWDRRQKAALARQRRSLPSHSLQRKRLHGKRPHANGLRWNTVQGDTFQSKFQWDNLEHDISQGGERSTSQGDDLEDNNWQEEDLQEEDLQGNDSQVDDSQDDSTQGDSTQDSPIHSTQKNRRYLSQIDGPTPRNKHGFAYSQKNKSTSVQHEVQYMSTMSVEVHVNTRGKFVPNPEHDEVQCVFWSVKSDETTLNSQSTSGEDAVQSGVVVVCTEDTMFERIRRQCRGQVMAESSELDLMVRLVEIVRTNDPDVLTGYEVHGGSWGYLIERARTKYEYNLCDEFSRMKTESHGRFGRENDRWGFNTTSTIRVTGRHMINIWRAMRGELNLLQYTMENVVWHLLHRRIPHYSWRTLTAWYTSRRTGDLVKLVQYYSIRARLDLEILEANDIVARTSEQARLLGVDFFSVFSRGSQFKVESIMFRIAKPENLLLVSPSRRQVGGQNALECLPLVMEPQSAFYTSPLLVLDFQSLYPSVMIAYNYCYSTFLGRITDWRGMNKMGFTRYERQKGMLGLLQEHINIAPNGMMYVKPEIRKSLLAKMLTEILETRIMVKSGMKRDKDDRTLQQLLNNRQLALKLLANVTYGYTSASFSGRMPCSEIADSIVQTGRETLERAIAYIHTVERWGAEVVYGDTDSLFVYLRGRTRAQAFEIGNEIAKAITDMNPRPIKLKFEKVYHPCVLLAKKRYVGYKYESPDQVKPEFDAKGIETVRRDGTPAEQKIEEKLLRMLFETADLSRIKRFFQVQCGKIMRGNVSIQDFCFAREVRLGTYSDKGAPPAGALISTRKMLADARAEPQYGERVPYVVITGAPGARLIDRCVSPEDLLENPHWRLDADYYISKNLIPPLERIFNLVGAHVRGWYDEMPKVRRIHHVVPQIGADGTVKKRVTLESYLQSTHCTVCTRRFKPQGSNQLCRRCRRNVPRSLTKLQERVQVEERRYEEDLSICRSCSGLGPLEEVKCDSKDCPVFWKRTRQLGKLRREKSLNEPAIKSLLEGVERSALRW